MSEAWADIGHGPAPAPPPPEYRHPEKSTTGQCRTPRCEYEGVLFPTPWSGDRTHCATCSGNAYRRHVEDTRQAVRALKAAAVTGNDQAEREAYQQLVALVGSHQAGETHQAVKNGIDLKPAKGNHR